MRSLFARHDQPSLPDTKSDAGSDDLRNESQPDRKLHARASSRSPREHSAKARRQFTSDIILPARNNHFKFQLVSQRQAAELINHFDMWLMAEFGGLLRIRFQIIHAAQIVQMLKLQPLVIAEKLATSTMADRIDLNPWVNRGMRFSCRPQPVRTSPAELNGCPEYP
jgi:hypothetical protein